MDQNKKRPGTSRKKKNLRPHLTTYNQKSLYTTVPGTKKKNGRRGRKYIENTGGKRLERTVSIPSGG